MTEVIPIPKRILKDLHEYVVKIEEILATLEEIIDEEGMGRVKKSLEEYKAGECVAAENLNDLKRILMEK